MSPPCVVSAATPDQHAADVAVLTLEGAVHLGRDIHVPGDDGHADIPAIIHALESRRESILLAHGLESLHPIERGDYSDPHAIDPGQARWSARNE